MCDVKARLAKVMLRSLPKAVDQCEPDLQDREPVLPCVMSEQRLSSKDTSNLMGLSIRKNFQHWGFSSEEIPRVHLLLPTCHPRIEFRLCVPMLDAVACPNYDKGPKKQKRIRLRWNFKKCRRHFEKIRHKVAGVLIWQLQSLIPGQSDGTPEMLKFHLIIPFVPFKEWRCPV